MTYEDERAVRDRLEEVARSAPPVGFGPADLIRRGRRRRQQHRGLAIGAAAAALALVVAVPAVVLGRGTTGGNGTLAGAAPSGRAAPSATADPPGGTARVPGPVPGITAAEAKALARGCGRAFGGDIGHVNPTPGPGETQGPLVRDAVRVYNAIRDADGLHALLYGPGVSLSCDRRDGNYNAGGSSGANPISLQWLPGPVSVDLHHGDMNSESVEGRVTGAVAEVDVLTAGRTMRVRPVNGTYLARFTGVGTTGGTGTLRVTARDRAGRALGTADGVDDRCYTGPRGQVVIEGAGDRTACRPATPWR